MLIGIPKADILHVAESTEQVMTQMLFNEGPTSARYGQANGESGRMLATVAATRQWRIGALVFLVVGVVGFPEPTSARDEPAILRTFGKATIAAWEEAGAETGWIGYSQGAFQLFTQELDDQILTEVLPAFQFSKQSNNLSKLPDPGLPFGLAILGFDTSEPKSGLRELTQSKNLRRLQLFSLKVTDAELKVIGKLEHLESLGLILTSVTDDGLKELTGLKNLRALYLANTTNVTDKGLIELSKIKTLRSLNLTSTKITDAGLDKLAALEGLQVLSLGGTKVTDAGLKKLKGLKRLQDLGLISTTVTDGGMRELAGLTNLQALNLGGTKVTDAGLRELTGLKKLRSLVLGYTQVTDAGLKELHSLESLRDINLLRTKVTDEGVAELRQALPDCDIVH